MEFEFLFAVLSNARSIFFFFFRHISPLGNRELFLSTIITVSKISKIPPIEPIKHSSVSIWRAGYKGIYIDEHFLFWELYYFFFITLLGNDNTFDFQRLFHRILLSPTYNLRTNIKYWYSRHCFLSGCTTCYTFFFFFVTAFERIFVSIKKKKKKMSTPICTLELFLSSLFHHICKFFFTRRTNSHGLTSFSHDTRLK